MKKDKQKDEPKKMWKLEGEAFEKVKAAHHQAVEATKEALRVRDEKKQAVWDAIHEALPEAHREAHLSLDTEAEQLGFYVVKESDCDHQGGLLGAILAAAKAS